MDKYFTLSPTRVVGPIATAAILSCSLCQDTISGMGGPGSGAICAGCASLILGDQIVELVARIKKTNCDFA